jgi:hypothetical protein
MPERLSRYVMATAPSLLEFAVTVEAQAAQTAAQPAAEVKVFTIYQCPWAYSTRIGA